MKLKVFVYSVWILCGLIGVSYAADAPCEQKSACAAHDPTDCDNANAQESALAYEARIAELREKCLKEMSLEQLIVTVNLLAGYANSCDEADPRCREAKIKYKSLSEKLTMLLAMPCTCCGSKNHDEKSACSGRGRCARAVLQAKEHGNGSAIARRASVQKYQFSKKYGLLANGATGTIVCERSEDGNTRGDSPRPIRGRQSNALLRKVSVNDISSYVNYFD